MKLLHSEFTSFFFCRNQAPFYYASDRHTGTRQNTQEHCRQFSEDVCSESAITAEHTGALQNTQEHGRTHRSTAEHTKHTRARQNTQEHGRIHRSTAERTGTQQNTQEHCRRFSEDVWSESAIFSMRGNTSAFPSYHFGEDVSGETPTFENMSNSRLPIWGGCLRRNAYF